MTDKPRSPEQKLSDAFAELKPYVLHAGEVLVEKVEDNSSGQTARLRFAEDTHPLAELLRTNDGYSRSRIVQIIVIETDDKGTPIDQQRRYQLRNAELKGGEYCKKFHVLKSDINFHRWMYKEQGYEALAELATSKLRQDWCEKWMRQNILDNQSSRMLDHNPALQERFVEHMWNPFHEWQREREAVRDQSRA